MTSDSPVNAARAPANANTRAVRVRFILSSICFLLLALVSQPRVLGLVLDESYIGQFEERRYFTTVSLLSLAAAVTSLAMFARPIARFASVVLYVAGLVLATEYLAALFVHAHTRETHLPRRQPAFTYHPSLVGLPTPGYRRTVSGVSVAHNAAGLRGGPIGPRDPNRVRVVAVGGSTTYCVTVSNEQTWPHRLGQLLGSQFEVLNYGVPGHSSAEHVILTALRLSELEPKYIIYYMGWNDLRNSHLAHLRGDYSDFHFPEQYGSLQVEQGYRSTSSVLFLVKWALVKLGEMDPPRYLLKDGRGHVSDAVDERLARIYERNVRLLVTVSRTIGAEPLLVPQVFNEHFAATDATTWWAPLLPTRAVPKVGHRFNEIMENVSQTSGAPFLGGVLAANWQAEDFVDQGHFSVSGNEKMARALSAELRKNGLLKCAAK